MTLYKWSQTPASNATADSTINWAEGQAPSSVNDSARAMMTAVAKYRDDVAGYGMVTGGSSTAYSVTSHQVFSSTTLMTGMEISIVPHATSGDNPTINVDSLGAFPIYMSTTSAPPAGSLVAGTIYSMIFNTTHWLLKSFFGNPYNIPLGGFLPYAGTTAPNSSFVLPFGQAISRTTYATLFSLVGTTYGAGDGTTFNIPDLRGRGIFFKDNMGGSAASRITSAGSGIDAANLSAVGGTETHTLTIAQTPAHDHGGNTGAMSANASHSHSGVPAPSGNTTTPYTFVGTAAANEFINPGGSSSATNTDHTHAIGSQGGGGAHNNMPPAYILNCIMRVI